MDNKFQESVNWNIRDELKGSSLDHIRSQRKLRGFGIGLMNTNGELNLGMSMRTAEIFGANDFFTFGKRRFDKRSTVGAQNYIDVQKYDTIYEFLEDIKNECSWGYQPYYIETQGIPLSIDGIRRIKQSCSFRFVKPLFIFGSESEGIPKDLLENNPHYVYSIEQSGVLRSLNVSAAVAAVAGLFVHV